MWQVPPMTDNNTKPISTPSSLTPLFFPTSLISHYHSHSFSHPFLLFSFIVATPTLADRVTFVFSSSTPKGYSVRGLELKLAISCSVWDELPRNRKAVSEQQLHSCSLSLYSQSQHFYTLSVYILLCKCVLFRRTSQYGSSCYSNILCFCLLGGFAVLPTVSISFVTLSVCPSVRIEQLGSQ